MNLLQTNTKDLPELLIARQNIENMLSELNNHVAHLTYIHRGLQEFYHI